MDFLGYVLAVPLLFCVGIYIVFPTLLILHPWIQIKMVFLHIVKWPLMLMDFTDPKKYGLRGGRCFYLPVAKGVSIGVWHILPASVVVPEKDEDYTSSLKDGKPIFIYFHGTGGTRAHTPRCNMYRRLSSFDCHVFSIDYRGYAESSGSPSEEGVVEDALCTYRWIKDRCGSSPIIVWGHSLGSGVATLTVRKLCNSGKDYLTSWLSFSCYQNFPWYSQTGCDIAGLVLEAPFNNLREAASQHPLTLPFRFLPWFERAFLDTVQQNNIYFANDEHIAHVTSPVMIVHSKDDGDVPIGLGKKLYESAIKTRPRAAGPVSFYALDHCGHINISQAPEFPHVVRKFLKTCGYIDPSVNDASDADVDWKELSIGSLNNSIKQY